MHKQAVSWSAKLASRRPMAKWIVAGVGLVILSLFPANGRAATLAENKALCANESGARAMAACTSLIVAKGLSPHNLAAAYINRAVLASDAGDLDNAIADLTQAILVDPSYELARANRGRMYQKKGDLERAEADYIAALKLDPMDTDAGVNLFRIHSRMHAPGHKPSASDAELSAKAAQAVKAGQAAERNGRPDEAIAAFTRALGDDPMLADAYAWRGFAHGDKGEWEAAIADGLASVRLAPTNANFSYLLGFSLMAVKDYDRAIASFDHAAQLAPKESDYVYMIGQAEEEKGDLDAAVAAYRRILTIKPDHKGATAALARLGPKAAAGSEPVSAPQASPSPGEKGGAGLTQASSCRDVDGKTNGTPTPARAAQIKDAEASYKQMLDAYGRQDWQGVVGAADAILAVNWRVCESYQKQGDAFFHLGKLDRAIKDYQNVLRDTPANQAVKTALKAAQKAADDAKNAARDTEEKRVTSLRNQIADRMAKGDWQSVVDAATALLAINTDSARALWDDVQERRGDAYMRLQRPGDALKDYRTAAADVLLSPADHARLATKMKAAENAIPAQTLAKLSQRIAAAPHDAGALDERARFYQGQKDWQRALADYDALVDLHAHEAPDSPAIWQGLTLSDVYIGRGDVLMALKRFDQAYDDFVKAMTYERELKTDWRSSKAYGGLVDANKARVRAEERPLDQLCTGDACGALDMLRDSDRACLVVENKGPQSVDVTITTDRDKRHVILRKSDYTGGFVGVPLVGGVYDCLPGVAQRIEAGTELCLTAEGDLPAGYSSPHALDDRIADCGRVIDGFGSLYFAQGEFHDLGHLYLLRGENDEQKGDLQAALADYSMTNDAGALSPEGLYRRGLIYLKLNQPNWAAIDFHFAHDIDFTLKDAARLAEKYVPRERPALLAAIYDPRHGGELYRPELAKDLKRGFVRSDGLLFSSGDDLRASRADAVRFNPNALVAWNNLGVVDLALDRTKDAIADFTQALAIKPRQDAVPDGFAFQHWEPIDAGIHYNLGIAYEKAGDATKAASEYKVAAKYRSDEAIRAAWLRTDPVAAATFKTHAPSADECTGNACGLLRLRQAEGENGASCLSVELAGDPGSTFAAVEIDYTSHPSPSALGLVQSPPERKTATLSKSGTGGFPRTACLQYLEGAMAAKTIMLTNEQVSGATSPQKPSSDTSPTPRIMLTKQEKMAIGRDPDGYLRSVLAPLLQKHDQGGVCKAVAKVLAVAPGATFAKGIGQQAKCP